MSRTERRKHKRVPVDMAARIFVEGINEHIDGRILNLSQGGMFIQADVGFLMGQTVLVEILLGGLEVLPLSARIGSSADKVHKSESDGASVMRWSSHKEFGVEFEELTPKAKKIIQELLKKNDKKS